MSLFQNPIFQAINSNSSNALNTAIINGEKINVSDESGITSLDYALLTLKYSMVKHILVFVNLLLPSEKNVMLNSALMTLVKAMNKYVTMNKDEDLSDDLAVFNDLKAAGADLNIVDEESNSLYHYAIKINSEALFNILINANNDTNKVNVAGHTVLLYAFLYNRTNLLSTLVFKCNDLNFKDRHSQKSYLHYAIEGDNLEIVQQLIDAQPQLLMVTDDSQKNVLHYIIERFPKETVHSYIDYFNGQFNKNGSTLSNDQQVSFFNAQDNIGNTPLHYAIQKHMLRGSCGCVIKKLVENQGNLYIKNKLGIMPIQMDSMSKDFVNELCNI